MKKEKRSVAVKLSTIITKVIDGSYSCPAGKSGYCNLLMGLLLEAVKSIFLVNLAEFLRMTASSCYFFLGNGEHLRKIVFSAKYNFSEIEK